MSPQFGAKEASSGLVLVYAVSRQDPSSYSSTKEKRKKYVLASTLLSHEHVALVDYQGELLQPVLSFSPVMVCSTTTRIVFS